MYHKTPSRTTPARHMTPQLPKKMRTENRAHFKPFFQNRNRFRPISSL